MNELHCLLDDPVLEPYLRPLFTGGEWDQLLPSLCQALDGAPLEAVTSAHNTASTLLTALSLDDECDARVRAVAGDVVAATHAALQARGIDPWLQPQLTVPRWDAPQWQQQALAPAELPELRTANPSS